MFWIALGFLFLFNFAHIHGIKEMLEMCPLFVNTLLKLPEKCLRVLSAVVFGVALDLALALGDGEKTVSFRLTSN